MIVHKVKVYPSKIHLPKKKQLAWKIAEIASDNSKLNKDAIDMVINRIIDNASVAIASLNRKPVISSREMALKHLKKIGINNFFEYVAGHNTFEYCKPDPRHLTSVIEILGGDIKKTLMIGDSETDANAAKNAGIPIILLEDGYTEKKTTEIYHNHLVKDFIGIEKIVFKYL